MLPRNWHFNGFEIAIIASRMTNEEPADAAAREHARVDLIDIVPHVGEADNILLSATAT